MKLLVLLPTGCADAPVPALDGRTPLAAARTPQLDALAKEGRVGLARHASAGALPVSHQALLSVLGYDPLREQVSRGGLEAAGLGVALGPDDLAYRLNFVATFQGRLIDFHAGQMNSVEARLLVEALQHELGGERFDVHAGTGYRNLLVVHDARGLQIETTAPQWVAGKPVSDGLPKGRDAKLLLDFMSSAAKVLARHDINRVRIDLGENPAAHVWPWGGGTRAVVEPFELRHGLSLGVVAAVPLARGLGRTLGAEVRDVPGATGGWDTDYAAKVSAALELLARHDVVLLHLGAPNEASHPGNPRLKVSVLEDVDRRVVAPLRAALVKRDDVRLLVTTDHMTPLPGGRVTSEVPFVIWGPGIAPTRDVPFTEEGAAAADLRVDEGRLLFDWLLGRRGSPTGRLVADG
ncbi:MAG: 2,3-bisphosphoglycerate-independent phosphoglycerate mutase [Planctomycetes bacterium]|nr:2,3-bisphosphoglycerate-independent phosphoglycerate mutase [Planctomycetota bacterium]